MEHVACEWQGWGRAGNTKARPAGLHAEPSERGQERNCLGQGQQPGLATSTESVLPHKVQQETQRQEGGTTKATEYRRRLRDPREVGTSPSLP